MHLLEDVTVFWLFSVCESVSMAVCAVASGLSAQSLAIGWFILTLSLRRGEFKSWPFIIYIFSSLLVLVGAIALPNVVLQLSPQARMSTRKLAQRCAPALGAPLRSSNGALRLYLSKQPPAKHPLAALTLPKGSASRNLEVSLSVSTTQTSHVALPILSCQSLHL